jgi:hypothetical protein
MGRWLDRYRAGDCARVWMEMTSLRQEFRGTAEWADAEEVCRLTMERARSNVGRLITMLPATGFKFHRPDDELLIAIRPAEVEELDRFEREVGPIPLALRVWMDIVGQVDLNGFNPSWDIDILDPLVVQVPVDYVWSQYAMWWDDRGTEWDEGPFRVEIAPDWLHKANISGGAPYSMVVPDASVDSLLLWEPHQTTFVNYLRHSFEWAGFPGLDPASGHRGPSKRMSLPVELSEIVRSLEPI